MRVALYCRCGGLWVGTAWTQDAARRLEAWFRGTHTRPRCAPTDSESCRRTRSSVYAGNTTNQQIISERKGPC
jgi:hypothetical protein